MSCYRNKLYESALNTHTSDPNKIAGVVVGGGGVGWGCVVMTHNEQMQRGTERETETSSAWLVFP